MYSVIIDFILDISDVVLDIGKDNAAFNDATNILHTERDIIMSDVFDTYSPFNPEGSFNPDIYGWKNKTIQIFDSDNNLIFSGFIYDLIESENENTKQIALKTKSEIGSVLRYPIEVNDKDTHTGFVLNGDHAKGTQLILLKSGLTDLPPISIMTYTSSLVPSYQAINPQGTPTNNIDIDRGLESDLLDNHVLEFSIPLIKTPAEAMKDALLLAFARIDQVARINTATFDAIHAIDFAANRFLWLFIRLNDKFTLGQYIDKLSEMSGYYIRQNSTGQIELINGIPYDGNNPVVNITDNEIVYSTVTRYNQERLLYGYSLPYLYGTEIRLKNVFLPDLDPDLLQWQNQKIFSVDYSDIIAIKNNILYIDEATAQHFGDKKLDYYRIPREQFSCTITENFLNGGPVNLKLFDKFLLNTNHYVNEPVICLQYDYDDKEGTYKNCIFELNNRIYPGFPNPL